MRKDIWEKGGFVFKIDFENTYDHVDWEFLDHALEIKCFR